jgi:2-oxoglutarate/2-oxoacid ferredoxin oxidoreductase subunit alpha
MQRGLEIDGSHGGPGASPGPADPASADSGSPAPQSGSVKINDFAFKLANVNGTGSASANALLMQAIFRMGIPVSGKNLFPSNIQGLPTWYEIRVNKNGHTARTAEYELMVAMNAETYAQDVKEVCPGGWVLYDSTWPLRPSLLRPDVTFLGVPFARLCNDAFSQARERTLMKNIAYAGTLAALLDIDMDVVADMLKEKFSRKPALMESNRTAIQLGYKYAKDHFECPLPIRLRKMEATKKSVLIDGNTATALGCLYAGATVAAWYPITPSTSVLDAFKSLCEKYRTDKETGKRRYCIVQAEDELAAVGMVIGAAWNGARAFTSTAGPGISLMNELVGLAYYAEIPIVIVDVQRVGPSTGMPTRTQQGDILLSAYASHGDTKHLLLFPGNPEECFYFAVKAFDLAERFQTPVFILSDLDIGMNDWVIPRLKWDDSYRPDRGRVLSREELEAIPKFYRYWPEDEIGVAARSLPGVHEKGAFFTRGSGHNKLGGYTEQPDEYQEVMDRLARKHAAARSFVPKAVIERREGASFGVLTVGGCDLAVREALEALDARGLRGDYLRVRAFPFGSEVESFLREHDPVFVVEQNRDGQLLSLITLETPVPKEKLRSVRAYGGFPLQANQVIRGIETQLRARNNHVHGHSADATLDGPEASHVRANGGSVRP